MSDTDTKKLAPYKAYFKYRSSSMKGKLPISGHGAMHKFVHGEWEKYSPAEQEAWRISEAQLRDLIHIPPGKKDGSSVKYKYKRKPNKFILFRSCRVK